LGIRSSSAGRHLPIQNFSKIMSRTSSVVVSPTISPRWSRALCSSMANRSGVKPWSRGRSPSGSQGLGQRRLVADVGHACVAGLRQFRPGPPDAYLFDGIPGGAGHRCDDGAFFPEQGVKQAGFADIRPPQDNDGNAFPEDFSLVGGGNQCRQRFQRFPGQIDAGHQRGHP